jgi:hypothetical protein
MQINRVKGIAKGKKKKENMLKGRYSTSVRESSNNANIILNRTGDWCRPLLF